MRLVPPSSVTVTPVIPIQQAWSSEEGRCPKPTPRSKPEDGLILAGVAIASSCQVVLPVFGVLFLIVGTVLTLASYRGPEAAEDHQHYEERLKLTSNLRVLGPCCLAMGLAMLLAGSSLCVLSRRSKRAKLAFRCPIHGDFYPISSQGNLLSLSKRGSLGVCGRTESSEETLGLPPTPLCPHSNRSSLCAGGPPPHAQPPATLGAAAASARSTSPLPPIATSTSMNGLSTSTYQLGEMSGGSTHSLAVSYDVASFPHSRDPSPLRLSESARGARQLSAETRSQ